MIKYHDTIQACKHMAKISLLQPEKGRSPSKKGTFHIFENILGVAV